MSDLPLFDRLKDDGSQAGEQRRVFTVSEINLAVRLHLESQWNDIWIEGELSDVHKSAAGHAYFTLNDEKSQSQLRCVMFRGDLGRARVGFDNGARVELGGGLSLFESRGQFQFIARKVRTIGEGDLAARFAEIRKKLESEGLFDMESKRELPLLPSTIGVVTSAAGAALQDVIRVASARAPVRIVVADCRVQGQDAPKMIVQAIEAIQKLEELDAVIITRGGGSAEDLWAFNDERVARAIAECLVPTVSGVGHEVDLTIADLVADVRAATPSNAAELLVPEKESLVDHVQNLERRLVRAIETKIDRERLRLEQIIRALDDPRYALSSVRARMASLQHGLLRAIYAMFSSQRAHINKTNKQLLQSDPRTRLQRDRTRWLRLDLALRSIGTQLVGDRRVRFSRAIGQLDALSPLAVLHRGYAIALHKGNGQAITSSSEVKVGDAISIKLARGSLETNVESTS